MTNKEYIENLCTFINHFKDEIEYEGYGDKIFDTEQAQKDIETFEAAIRALEFYNKAEVVISQLREDRDRFQNAFDKIRSEIEQIADEEQKHDVNNMPSVTQTPKYWIDKDNKLYKMPDDIPTMTIQYPTMTHRDTISRTEVMNVISDFVALEKYIDKHNHITFEPLEQMINALPPVTQKCEKCAMNGSSSKYCDNCKSSRHKGHWIPIYQGDEIINYHCSECELGDTNGSINLYGWDYCRRCGAEMESRQNE